MYPLFPWGIARDSRPTNWGSLSTALVRVATPRSEPAKRCYSSYSNLYRGNVEPSSSGLLGKNLSRLSAFHAAGGNAGTGRV